VIGPGDFATGIGLKGRADHPDELEVIKTLEEMIRNSPVVLGGVAPPPQQANEMIKQGYQALAMGFYWSLLQKGIAAAIDGVRR
jgi:4-hydroxy-2-oxoheptanedioate aldolase